MKTMPNFFAQFTDAHAHLPRDAARDADVRVPAGARILLNAARPADFPRVAAFAKKFQREIVPAFGVHPWFADEWNAASKDALCRFLAETENATVGEIGLDKCRGNADAQERAFREQLALAVEFRVPASIHCVRAFGKTERVLRGVLASAGTLPPLLFHAYSGSAEQAKIFARLGAVFSAPRKPLPPECAVVPETDAPLRVPARAPNP